MITDDRYKQIMSDLGLQNSLSLMLALKQIAMESALNERERCVAICEKRAANRFAENGTTEPDTNASYYEGAGADSFEAQDEECEDIVKAIRAH